MKNRAKQKGFTAKYLYNHVIPLRLRYDFFSQMMYSPCSYDSWLSCGKAPGVCCTERKLGRAVYKPIISVFSVREHLP
jgi:hypothetical protein